MQPPRMMKMHLQIQSAIPRGRRRRFLFAQPCTPTPRSVGCSARVASRTRCTVPDPTAPWRPSTTRLPAPSESRMQRGGGWRRRRRCTPAIRRVRRCSRHLATWPAARSWWKTWAAATSCFTPSRKATAISAPLRQLSSPRSPGAWPRGGTPSAGRCAPAAFTARWARRVNPKSGGGPRGGHESSERSWSSELRSCSNAPAAACSLTTTPCATPTPHFNPHQPK
mmetsp:Transcript_18399/g.57095  ORF Transcript_18399/g.57095 Transcript_18399/m.57095 type:complete len:224 (-) Transcript_18399:81-752(-)